MRSNSDHYPEITVQSNSKTQINYNISEVTKEEMDGTKRQSYDYEYVEIEGEITRAKIINAIIANIYSKDAELALINNELANPNTEGYKAYQALRAKAKKVASAVMGGFGQFD